MTDPVPPPAGSESTTEVASTPSEAPSESKAGLRPWFAWLLILLVSTAAVVFLWPRIAGKNASAASTSRDRAAGPQVIPVVVGNSRTGDISIYYWGVGAVTPLSTVTIKSRVDGQLMSVRYKEGEAVHQGDLLVEIDDSTYRAALTQAEGQLMRDQATLENARIDLARYQQLLPQKAIPEQQVATQQATVHQDEGVVKIDQGLIETAKVNLSYCKISAPLTGRIGLRLVDAGNIVHASDTTGLLVITQMDPTSVLFTLPEDQLPAVLKKVASGARLQAACFDREGQTKLADGSLSTLDNQVDPTTGTLKLRATFDNSRGILFPNQFVNIRLLIQQKHGAILIPTAAVQRNSQATYVYVVKADSTVTVRQITTGATEGDDTEVLTGLQPGESLVMTGVDKLQEGTKVRAQQADAPTSVKSNKNSGRGKQP